MDSFLFFLSFFFLKHSHVGDACTCCPVKGKSNGSVPLYQINSVSTDMPNQACGKACFPTTAVVMGLPLGHPLANAGGRGGGKHSAAIPNMMLAIMCNEEEADPLMRIIRQSLVNNQQQTMMVKERNIFLSF